MPTRTAVIGAGVSGLSAALERRARGDEVLVFERSDGPGGVMRTRRSDGYLFEDGPNSIPGGATSFLDLCAELGLGGAVIPCAAAATRRCFVRRGRWVAAPSTPGAFLLSPLLGLRDKLRVLREPKAPQRASAPGADEETVYAFVARRFGRGAAETLLDAITAGVNGGDPRTLGVESAFPELAAMEREHGSVFRALRAKAAARRARGEAKPPAVVTLRDGLGALADAAAARLGDGFRRSTRVVAVRRGADGGYDLAVEGPRGAERVRVDRVVAATPPAETAALLAALSPAASARLAATTSASMAVVQLGFDGADLPGLRPSFGALVPRAEGLRTLGWLLPSCVFPGRAPAGGVAVCAYLGGAFDPAAVEADDDALVETATRELATTLRLPRAPRAATRRVVRRPHALPLPTPGHATRMAEAVAALRRDAPGVAFVGNVLAGSAVPKCIASAKAAAAALG